LWSSYEGEFPLLSNKTKYYNFFEGFPEDIQEKSLEKKTSLSKEAEQLTFRTFSYQVFNKTEGKNLSQSAKVRISFFFLINTNFFKKILGSVGVLDYFFKAIFFDRTVKNLTSFFLVFEESQMMIRYPGIYFFQSKNK
jgi:hypothetical protein